MIELKPKKVFDIFKQINAVPRPSKHEEKMIEFLKDFAAERGLPFKVDECGNVLITKDATPGMENRAKVVMQGHMDMVCEKNGDVDFDFYNDTIQTYIDGEWMKAKGTTLGADCGIGDALALAILDADDVQHGPIECLFTRDEETGLTGAFEMKPGFMTGKYLINLDSEDEGEIFVGCAGGVNTTATFRFSKVDVPQGYFSMKVSVAGLQGGHSGDDINKSRANANKLLARFLYLEMQKMNVMVSEIQGGNLHNAIPREASAIISVPADCKETVKVDMNIFAADVETEFSVTEKSLNINVTSTTPQAQAIDPTTARNLIFALQAAHNGILAMSQDIEGLVETSSNLASVKMNDNEITVVTSQRSSIGSARDNMANTIQAVFRLAGAEVVSNDGYPGWKPNPDSQLLKITVASYKRLFGKAPKVKAIHAGLECGLFSEKYPGLDMVSFGPTLRGVHSPDEKLLVPTVEMVWNHLIDILKNIPEE